jgi:hypothetical protein
LKRSILLAVGLAVGAASCGGMTNQFSGTQHLTIASVVPGGTWTGYSETTFQDSIPAGKTVHLTSVTLTSSSGEFSWLSSTQGATPSGTQVVSLSSMEKITGPATLNIDYTGDLRSELVNANTVRINWNEQFAQSVKPYPDGLTVTVAYTIELDPSS